MAMQRKAFEMQFLQDRTAVEGTVTPAPVTPTFQFQEKLFCGPFGAFGQCEFYPAWSAEQMKSPGLLHIHNMQIQMALETQWWNSLYLQAYCYSKAGGLRLLKVSRL